MKDGYYEDLEGNKVIQEMYFVDSDNKKIPKGLKQVLEERGYDTKRKNKADLQEIMRNEDDFVEDAKTCKAIIASKEVNKYSKVLFLPKYHCELNMMENVWMDTKNDYDRSQDFKGKTHDMIKKRICEIMDNIPLERARKYIMNSIAYCYGYESGLCGERVMEKIKDLKKARMSHRRAPSNLVID